jgi:integrase
VARASTGGVVEKQTTRGTSYGVRFRALGKRQFVHVGYAVDGWTRRRVEQELQNVLADVRRGMWQPPRDPEPVAEPPRMPTFHAFSSAWFEARKIEGGRRGQGLSPKGEADLRWRLSNHLLPALAGKPLDRITVADVDAFRRAKVREGLSSTSVNKLLACLSAILEEAVDHEHIERNPARGKRRRLPASTPRRTTIDRAEHIAALLDAAGALDAERRSRPFRRPLLALLVLAGPRIGEALALRWRDVHLADGWIRIRGTKTDAAERRVYLLPLLRDELLTHAARRPDNDPDALVFPTATGRAYGATNIRRRVLTPAVDAANERLEERGVEPLSHLTPHSLRRTYASLLYATGEAPPYVMAQMGHTTPHLALAIYAKAMDRRDGEPERLRALVDGVDWAPAGTSSIETTRDAELAPSS